VDVRSRESSATNAGKVLEQSPAAGERAEKGSRVVIEVGDGRATVKVPDVVGLSLSEAKAALDRAGLTVGLQREIPSDTVPKGVVVEQGYPVGTEVGTGTAVNIRVSSGPQRVVAPAPSTSAPASAPTSAPALGEDAEEGEEIGNDNSGPGSSGSGNSGSGSGE
jgi:serine/threonine-protein kinase